MTRSLLSVLLAATALPMAAAAQEMSAPDTVIEVAADSTILDLAVTGEIDVVPDLVLVSAGVVSEAPTASAALSQNSSAMQRVVEALRAAGVAERDIQTDRVSLNPRYDYQDNRAPRLVGYSSTNSVRVRFRDIDRSGAILDALVQSGANQIEGPSFTLDEPEAARDSARLDAVRMGQARANAYAAALGKRVVRLISVSETGRQSDMPIVVTGRRISSADAMAAPPPPPIAPGEQHVGVTLMMRFELR